MTMLMKRAMVSLPCFGSGSTERCGVFPLRDMARFSVGRISTRRFFRMADQDPPCECLRAERPVNSALRTLGAVLGAALAALGHAGGVQRAAHGVVAHARQVLDAAAADQHHRV